MIGDFSGPNACFMACLAVFSFASITDVAAQQRSAGAHQHGTSELTIAQAGTRIDIRLVSPGSDIVGFERNPGTDEERLRLSNAIAQLEAPHELFTFQPSTDCRIERAKVAFGDDDHDHDNDDHENHDEAGGEDHGNHAEFVAEYQLECSAAASISGINLTIFSHFEAMEALTLQYVFNGKIGRLKTGRDQTQLTF